MQIGDLSVLISKGNTAIIAAVIRGEIPDGYRTEITSVLDAFEFEYLDELKSPDLDTGFFLGFNQRLIELLQSKLKHEERGEARDKDNNSKLKKICLASLLLLGLGWYWFHSYTSGRTWKKFFEYIDDQPGIVVTEVEKKGEFFRVQGLRDPLSTDPEKLFMRQEFYEQDKVIFDFQPFHSLETEIVRQRVIRKFSPPDEVKVSVSPEGVLSAQGVASLNWVRNFGRHSPSVSGVKEVDVSKLAVSQKGRFDELKTKIEKEFIVLSTDSDSLSNTLSSESIDKLHSMAKDLLEFGQLAIRLSKSQRYILKIYNPSRKRTDPPRAIDLVCLLYTSPSPRDRTRSRMPSSA